MVTTPQVLEERRSAALTDVELRDGETGTMFSGYAAIFDEETELPNFREVVAPGAFSKTLADGADVRMLINHDGIPVARTKSGTLTLTQDKHGLRVQAQLDPANPKVAELRSAMTRGDIDQMSFGFRAVKETPAEDNDGLRVLREVELFDVSPVTYPAYEGTSAEMRSATKLDLLARYATSLGLHATDWPTSAEPPEVRAEPDPEPQPHSDHSLEALRARNDNRKRKALACISTS